MISEGTAGRRGSGVRSDCYVSVAIKESGGIVPKVKSKVGAIFGGGIETMCIEVLSSLGFEHAEVIIEDQGALPFVISGRIEAAARRASGGDLDAEYLPPVSSRCTYGTSRERFRRSRLYLPGNEPKFFINAGLHLPDGVILDLEDSVAPSEKDAARTIVRNTLRSVDFRGSERMVRINQLPMGLEDLDYIIPHNVHVVLIPKCESAAQVLEVDKKIKNILAGKGIDQTVFLMPIIESALGTIRAFEIASAAETVIALAVGLEDYTADLGCSRTKEGRESFWARSQVVNAARAAGVQPIDTVFSDVGDMDGLRESVKEAKSLGFDGKGCIHPRQIAVVHEAMAPEEAEVAKACRIVEVFEQAEAAGLGVVSIGTKMIDPPVVKRAVSTVKYAENMGMLEPGWRDRKEE